MVVINYRAAAADPDGGRCTTTPSTSASAASRTDAAAAARLRPRPPPPRHSASLRDDSAPPSDAECQGSGNNNNNNYLMVPSSNTVTTCAKSRRSKFLVANQQLSFDSYFAAASKKLTTTQQSIRLPRQNAAKSAPEFYAGVKTGKGGYLIGRMHNWWCSGTLSAKARGLVAKFANVDGLISGLRKAAAKKHRKFKGDKRRRSTDESPNAEKAASGDEFDLSAETSKCQAQLESGTEAVKSSVTDGESESATKDQRGAHSLRVVKEEDAFASCVRPENRLASRNSLPAPQSVTRCTIITDSKAAASEPRRHSTIIGADADERRKAEQKKLDEAAAYRRSISRSTCSTGSDVSCLSGGVGSTRQVASAALSAMLSHGATISAVDEESGEERQPTPSDEGTADKCGAKHCARSIFEKLLKCSLLQVSVDTMAITALPLDCWLKERLKNWVQLSGHEGTIVPASNHTLWKKQPCQNTIEAVAYAAIMKDSALRGLTPKFFKEILHKNESFIEIQDLLSQFPNTSARAVMDIKIGSRTFLESEVSNSTKRTDLYKKMIDIAPDEPSEEEHAEKAITKLRYMQFRERESSTASLGFRIEAAQLPGGKLQKSFKKVRTRDQVAETLLHFFGERGDEICVQLAERLRAIRHGIEHSEFFKSHEVVGSSILIVYDATRTGAWMIDFAKSTKVPDHIELNHRDQWELGNHEDGYLTGLDNLISIVENARSTKAEGVMQNRPEIIA